MSTWKKALSTLATAGLLASLLGTAFAAPVAANESPELLGDCVPASCATVAGNYVAVFGGADATTASGAGTYAFTVSSNGSFLAGAGGLTLFTAISVSDGAVYQAGWVGGTGGVSGSIKTTSQLWVYSASVGTVTVTEWKWNGASFDPTGNTYEVDFYAAADRQLSSSKSFAKLVVPGSDCSMNAAKTAFDDTAVTSASAYTASSVGTLCVRILNGAGEAVQGALVTMTMSTGVFVGPAPSVTDGTDANGVASAEFRGFNTPGAAAFSVSATKTGLGTATLSVGGFTFTGKVSTITAAVEQLACDASNEDNCDKAVSFIAKDSAGNLVVTDASAVASTNAPFIVNGAVTQFAGKKTTAPGYVNLACQKAGSGTVTVKQTANTASGSAVTSSAVTIYCSGAADSWTVAFAKSTVAPGGNVSLTLTAKDEDGQPAYLGGIGTVKITTSTGNIVDGSEADNGDGTVTWTYLAPFNTGVATAAVNVGTETKYASINVTNVVPVTSGITARVGTASYASTTRVARLGQTITWRGALGATAADASVGVYMRSRNADGTWSSIRRWATRTADASGNVTFSYKYSASKWIQIRFVAEGGSTSFLGGVWR